MTDRSPRSFAHRTAVREKTPILVGVDGPSGSGKTYSALRLASGFRRVTKGKLFVVDSEARRALAYADRFEFEHVPFGAPFGPLDYLDVLAYCIAQGATDIIVDSTSHEHEGPGGVLEQHTAEVKRLGGLAKHNLPAWAKPKAERRALINWILQQTCNFVFCFRAKEKLKIVPGKEPVHLGWMPIAGDDWQYEMTVNCLLLPGSNGVPIWRSQEIGEQAAIKLPIQFKELFATNPQLSEDIGEQLARWAAGGVTEKMTVEQLAAGYATCSDFASFRALQTARAAIWKGMPKDDQARLLEAVRLAEKRMADAAVVTAAAATPEPDKDAPVTTPDTTPPAAKADADADIQL